MEALLPLSLHLSLASPEMSEQMSRSGTSTPRLSLAVAVNANRSGCLTSLHIGRHSERSFANPLKLLTWQAGKGITTCVTCFTTIGQRGCHGCVCRGRAHQRNTNR
jgi:hypothetical protein